MTPDGEGTNSLATNKKVRTSRTNKEEGTKEDKFDPSTELQKSYHCDVGWESACGGLCIRSAGIHSRAILLRKDAYIFFVAAERRESRVILE